MSGSGGGTRTRNLLINSLPRLVSVSPDAYGQAQFVGPICQLVLLCPAEYRVFREQIREHACDELRTPQIARSPDRAETGIDRGFVLAFRKSDVCGQARPGIGVGVAAVVAARVLRGEAEPGRWREPDAIVAGREPGEGVEAVVSRRPGGKLAARPVEQGHQDIGQARFAAVLHAVGVGIKPRKVADGRPLHLSKASVDAGDAPAGNEGDNGGPACRRVHVRVQVVAALVRLRERESGRQPEPDHVVAFGQSLERVMAGAVGFRLGDDLPRRVEKHYTCAGNSGLSGILHAVAVEIAPDEVAD